MSPNLSATADDCPSPEVERAACLLQKERVAAVGDPLTLQDTKTSSSASENDGNDWEDF